MPFAPLAAGFLPVLLFLAGLRLMDSYKLVPWRTLAASLVAGALAAGLAYLANTAIIFGAHVPLPVVPRLVAPVVEESLKALFLVWLIVGERVGFMVDAAICGFAVGTGFALIENIYYAQMLGDFTLGLWLARGLGTAIMHGSTTAMFAILAQGLRERRNHARPGIFVPGLLLAIGVHLVFNNFLTQNTLVTSVVMIVTMPILVLGVFEQSERATRDWLGRGLDGDIEALELILEGEMTATPIGRYLESLRSRFPGGVVADMLCLLRIHLELSLRAKGMLIARAAGVVVAPDASVRANLEEMRYLERAIGATGCLAMLPLRKTSSRDLWQIMLLSRRR